ncbi:SAM-dependent methyltransferase [Nocardia jiangxiensis]|uniref:SAM-dependent methyltransferase n=1 Tax=Nocardia jiangxiensis TaxID=282685 RepID=A0ABW6RVE1_9NOCA|nr:SAM-dependent methyltransferase [Nocardia jiangxiensis]
MSGDRPAPEGIDPAKPNAARVYDYLLGGKDNYSADRAVAKRMLEVAPENRTLAWFSRKFLTGAARLAAEGGVRQFIDIGAGIPTSPSVYETVAEIDPAVRVASVDYDPVVCVHANAITAGQTGVTPMHADFREPSDLIARLRTEAGIDFDQPVALLIVGVLHFIMDHERPAEILARFSEVMAPGSYVAFTHGSTETDDTFVNQTASDTKGSTAQFVFRSKSEVAKLFDGFDILDPGIVTVQEWLADNLPPTRLVILAGVGHKPEGPGDHG